MQQKQTLRLLETDKCLLRCLYLNADADTDANANAGVEMLILLRFPNGRNKSFPIAYRTNRLLITIKDVN